MKLKIINPFKRKPKTNITEQYFGNTTKEEQLLIDQIERYKRTKQLLQ